MGTTGRPPVSVRLMERVRREMSALGVELPKSARCVRQYANHGDRTAGAWLWFVHSDTDPVPDVGSVWRMREALTAPVWYVNKTSPTYGFGRVEWHIDLN